jgi:hypothetical protein
MSDDWSQPMEMLGNDDGRPEQRVGVRVRRDDVTVRVKGEDLPLTLGVEHAARLVGIGRSSMYASVKRGDFETIQVNGRIAVLTLPLLRRMGLRVPDIELPGH